MFEEGILKIGVNGRYEAVVDPTESEHIRSEVSMSKRKATMSAAEAERLNIQLDSLNNDEAN